MYIYIYIYVCMHVCMYVCTYIYIYIHVCVYVYACVCMYVCTYVCTYVRMYGCPRSQLTVWYPDTGVDYPGLQSGQLLRCDLTITINIQYFKEFTRTAGIFECKLAVLAFEKCKIVRSIAVYLPTPFDKRSQIWPWWLQWSRHQ